jgi:hypothetical protein
LNLKAPSKAVELNEKFRPAGVQVLAGEGDSVDWNTIARASQEAFREGVNEWIGKARIQGGQVNGPTAILTPGSLVSDGNIESTIVQKLTGSQVPAEISRALAKELAAAWHDWAAGFQIRIPAAYPSFAAFPGPMAPPTPAATGPVALSNGSSSGEAGLRAPILANKLSSAVKLYAGKVGGGAPDQALKKLASWVEISFTEWKSMAKMGGVTGKGPIPTFAPPYVPVGPVLRGENLSTGPVFVGPRFGKVAI